MGNRFPLKEARNLGAAFTYVFFTSSGSLKKRLAPMFLGAVFRIFYRLQFPIFLPPLPVPSKKSQLSGFQLRLPNTDWNGRGAGAIVNTFYQVLEFEFSISNLQYYFSTR